MKKRITSLLMVFALISVCFSGCGLSTGTIDDLIFPPNTSRDTQGLVKVLEDKVSSKTTFSSPKQGEFRSSVVTKDIDNDGINEALAFYYKVGNKNKINVMLFKNVDKKWIAAQNIEGQGSDIYSIDFLDMNNDGILEIAMGWSSSASNEKQIMTVYSYDYKSDSPLTTAFANIIYSLSSLADFNSDNRDELLLLNVSTKSSVNNEANATLYGYDTNDNFSVLGEAKIDSSVTSYTNVFIQQPSNENGVIAYVDGIKGDRIMVTEIIKWDESQRNITAPLYDASVSATVLTSKGVRVATRDINNDGIAEIPMDHSLIATSDKNTYLVEWNQILEKTLVPVQTSLINLNDGYMLHIDSSLSNKVCVNYSPDKKEWIAQSWDLTNNVAEGDIFTIKAVSRTQWKKDKDSSDYTELMYNGRMVYIGKVSERAKDYNITTDYLLTNISIY